MGLLPEQLLDLTLWQLNAYSQGNQLKQADELARLVEAAYYEAYWNGYSKGSKKSLKQVLKEIYKPFNKAKEKPEPIKVKEVSKEFENMEALRKYGWYQD